MMIPLAGGMLTRPLVIKKRGKDYFENTFHKIFDGITTIGLLPTLALLFSFQGNIILENQLHILLITVPLILQTFLIFTIAYVACHILKLSHKIAAPAGMIAASNFFELAAAVAIALFALHLRRRCYHGWDSNRGACYVVPGKDRKSDTGVVYM